MSEIPVLPPRNDWRGIMATIKANGTEWSYVDLSNITIRNLEVARTRITSLALQRGMVLNTRKHDGKLYARMRLAESANV